MNKENTVISGIPLHFSMLLNVINHFGTIVVLLMPSSYGPLLCEES